MVEVAVTTQLLEQVMKADIHP